MANNSIRKNKKKNTPENDSGLLLHKTRLYRSESFEGGLHKYLNEEGGQKFSEWVNEERWTAGDLSISSRVISHWEDKGILEVDEGKNNRRWRRFSVLDCVWLEIVTELRKFGMSLEKISELRSNNPEGGIYPEKSIFEMHVIGTLFLEKDCIFIATADGAGFFSTRDDVEMSLGLGFLNTNHVSIYLNLILDKLFSDFDIKKPQIRVTLSDKEVNVLEVIKNGDFESVKITPKKGGVQLIEKEKIIRDVSEEEIKKILKEGDYQKVEVIRTDGKNILVKQTKQTKT